MKKTLCYSVRLKELKSISPKAFKAVAFDGSSCILPKSCVFGQDFGVMKSDAYWIAEWIIKQKDIQYSSKKKAYFDEKGKMYPFIQVSHHEPETVNPVESNEITELQSE